MGTVSQDRYVNLNDHLKEEWTESVFGGNPVYLIDPAEGCADSITLSLSGVKGIHAWQRDEIPNHLHYGKSPRFPGIVVVADSLWSIGLRPGPGRSAGAHGYDPLFTQMHTIFYASGPGFRKNYVSGPILNVDVYGVIVHLLGITPSPGDGDLSRVTGLFPGDTPVANR